MTGYDSRLSYFCSFVMLILPYVRQKCNSVPNLSANAPRNGVSVQNETPRIIHLFQMKPSGSCYLCRN